MKLYIWRHPKPKNVHGVFLGHTDASVDKRKIKRLANQIERYAKQHKLPKEIWVSHLQRSRHVGELLAKRGWECHSTSLLAELNFGAWDGKRWQDIGKQAFEEWIDDFAHFNFSSEQMQGESVHELFARVHTWLESISDNLRGENALDKPILAVGHAGWINAATMISNNKNVPKEAADWPPMVSYRQRSVLDVH